MKHVEVKHKDGRPLLLPRTPRTLHIWFAIAVAILALVEIQFAVESYDFWYRTVRHWGFTPFEFRRLAQVGVYFPEFLVFLVLAVAVWVNKREWRHTIVTMVVAVGLASAFTGVVKDVAGRARPHHGVRLMTEGEKVAEVREFLELRGTPHPVLRTEDGDYWLIKVLWSDPALYFDFKHRPWFKGDYASFPSGHATSAFVLAAWLSLILPRTKYLWYFLAILTCLGRVFGVRHYPGDVMMGAVIGWGFSQVLFGSYLMTKISVKMTEGLEYVIERKPPSLRADAQKEEAKEPQQAS